LSRVSHDLLPGLAAKRVVLKPSRKKWTAVLLVSATFAGIGILMIRDGDGWGWVAAVLFGLGVLVSVLNLAGTQSLILTPSGFVLKSLLGKRTYRWSDIEQFYVAAVGVVTQVGWSYRPTYEGDIHARRLNRALGGPEAGLGDTFGMGGEDLARLMNAWRNHYETSVSTDEF
jgi:hypothetical protein